MTSEEYRLIEYSVVVPAQSHIYDICSGFAKCTAGGCVAVPITSDIEVIGTTFLELITARRSVLGFSVCLSSSTEDIPVS